MSLSGILGNALSGLQASQAGLRASSNNVANVNTPGYARTIASVEARNVGGVAMGVQVNGIVRIVDRHLQLTSLRSISDASVTQTNATALDRLQSQFGNLDDSGSIFARLNASFTGLSQASVDPTLSVARLSAAADLDSFFTEAERLSGEIRTQRQEADSQINATLQRSNEILRELFDLNASVQSVASSGGDSSGAENRVSELLDELSQHMDVRADFQGNGRVVLRTTDGVLLLDNYPANLTYKVSGSGSYGVEYGKIYAESPNGGNPQELDSHITSGSLRALIDLRDHTLPDVAEELAEMTAGAADALNAAHNNSAAYPAPQTLIGRNTGLESTDSHNFTGATTLAVADSTGQLVRRIDVDFDAATYSVDGGAAVAFAGTVGDLAAALNTALAGVGSASFANGVLSVSASSANNGVAFLQDEVSPSDRGGRGLSHFFGLNDLVRSDKPGFFEIGMSAAEPHNFTTGTSLSFRVDTVNGKTAGSYTIPMVTGGSVGDIITALNDTTSGVGRYVTFALDSDGQLDYTANPGYEGFELALTGDDTSRGTSGVSFSDLFGIGLDARASRAEGFAVDTKIRADSSRLALGKLDIDSATVVGDYVLSSGDNRGGSALQAALSTPRAFDAAGSLATSTASLGDYTARIAGTIGSRAARAESEAASAATLQATAAQKRADVEGVSLDEELAAMTLYQQSYNAAARMLQAAKEMTDTLMGIV